MNKRIRELVEQAWRERDLITSTRALDDAFTDKFAELIVRECMDVVDPGVNQVIARYQARQWLAEHFGVE